MGLAGLLTLHIRHTSASLVIRENVAPGVRADLERCMSRLVWDGDPICDHTDEGPDDMSSHLRSALAVTSFSIPVIGFVPALETWQGIHVYEHRRRPQRRPVAAHYIGK